MRSRRLLPFFLALALVLAAIPGTMATMAQESVHISIRCRANPAAGENWRCDNFHEIVEDVEAELGIDIDLETIQDNEDFSTYTQSFVLASEAGEAVDIILAGHEVAGTWSAGGYIIPLDDLIAQHEEFEDMVPSLWDSVSLNGVIWGVPQDAEARPLYWSKPLLADLGWSEEEIESLPGRIESGEFTFEDMLEVAAQAVDEGVVDEGNGFWHRPTNGTDFLYFYYGNGGEILDEDGNLVFEKDAALLTYQQLAHARDIGAMTANHLGIEWADWHPRVSSAEDVLFFAGGSYMWLEWAGIQSDRGGEDFMFENFGFGLMPALETGVPLEITHPLAWFISSSSDHPDVAMALIAATTTPEANNRHALGSGHLGILNTQLETEEYQADVFTSMVHPMLNYARYAPNHPGFSSWSNAFWLGIQAVESGELTPEAALDVVVAQLENELGDDIIIR